jgi:DNA polymerase IV
VPEPTILHVDMDAFYASVEQLQNPALRNKPLIVGGDGARGVVASCSYEARFYGVRSAMPSARAKRLCPQAIFVAGNFWLYEKYSRQMHDIFAEFTPKVEGISLDEAFLDISGATKLFGSPKDIAHLIRNRIYERLGLRVSIGAATTKHLAKLGSQAAKPKATKTGPVLGSGVVVIDDEHAISFLHRLAVRSLWGVGPSSAAKLEKLGITTVAQLANTPLPALKLAVGPANAQRLHDLAWNRDQRDVVSAREAKSIGHEQTYPSDLYGVDKIHKQLARLSDAVATRLRRSGVRGRTINVKVRFGTFETITRARTLDTATANSRLILSTVDELTANVDRTAGVRLLGISVSKLEMADESTQLSLGEAVDAEALKLDEVVDQIRNKFGSNAVASAQLVEAKGVNVMRQGERQWGPSRSDEAGSKW